MLYYYQLILIEERAAFGTVLREPVLICRTRRMFTNMYEEVQVHVPVPRGLSIKIKYASDSLLRVIEHRPLLFYKL